MSTMTRGIVLAILIDRDRSQKDLALRAVGEVDGNVEGLDAAGRLSPSDITVLDDRRGTLLAS